MNWLRTKKVGRHKMVKKGLSQEKDLVTVLEQRLVQQSRFRWQGPRVVFSATAASKPRGHFDPGCHLHSSKCYSSCSNIGVELLATSKCQKGCEASCFLSVSCCWMQRNSFNLWVRHCVGHNTLSNQVCIYSKPFDKGDVLS